MDEFKLPLLMRIAGVMVCIAAIIPLVSLGIRTCVVWGYGPCAGTNVTLYSTYSWEFLCLSALLIVACYAGRGLIRELRRA